MSESLMIIFILSLNEFQDARDKFVTSRKLATFEEKNKVQRIEHVKHKVMFQARDGTKNPSRTSLRYLIHSKYAELNGITKTS